MGIKDLPSAQDLLLEANSCLMKDIAKKYGVSYTCFINHIKREFPDFNGKKYFIQKLDPEQLYNEARFLDIHQLSKKYKVSNIALRQTIKSKYPYFSFNHGVIDYDFSFFEEINTEEKAYWLGFMYADGCVFLNERATDRGSYKGMYLTCINLAIKDESHIKKFQKQINSEHKLKYRIKSNSHLVSLRIHNKKMATDLIKQGCVTNKTFILKFPTENKVPNHLMKHFIRGYFDGDGTLFTLTHCSQMRAGFVGNHEFIQDLQNYLINNNVLSRHTKLDKNKNVYKLNITNKFDIYNLICYMYDDSSIYLDRKYNLYKSFQTLLIPKNKCCLSNCMNKQHHTIKVNSEFCYKHHYQNQKGLLIWV